MSIYETSLSVGKPGHLGAENWDLRDLNHITVIFGRNGAGKSALLRSIGSSVQEGRHLTSPERAGEISYNSGYADQEASGAQRYGNGRNNLSGEYRNRAISRIATMVNKRGFHMVPRSDDDSINDLQAMMKEVLPDFTFELTAQNPYYRLSRMDGSAVTTSAEVSSGEVGMLTLGVDLATVCAIWKIENQSERLLLIDEPDTHLHPDLQQHLALFLVKLMDKYDVQIIIATHSTTLLAALGQYGKDRTSAIYLSGTPDKQHATVFSKYLQEMSSCLGGHALMGPLFGAPLLLVEGDDDYRIWRHNKVKLAVLPCNGDEIFHYQQKLEQIFASLRTTAVPPAGYTLVDGDKTLPNPATNPQKLVPIIQLACHEAENLYLADEVLAALSVTWDEAKVKLKAATLADPSKAALLYNCDAWDRENEDIKPVINDIASILDSKQIHWTRLLGGVLGKNKPTGQLAAFLGPQVISALWP
jgi:predicted ATPase